ncbi:MAG: AAA family ATPase [Segetibacter sp.]
MNYIKNIEIKNFKSIRHQKIDDCRRVNVFIGYPNVGKSNILEAIGLFNLLDTQEGNTIEFKDIVRINELSQLFTNGDITSKISIQVNGFFNIEISHLEMGCSFEIYSTEKIKGAMPLIVPEKENNRQHIVVLNGHLNNPSQLILEESRIVNRIDAKQIEPVRRYLFNSNHSSTTVKSLNYLNAPFGNNISKIIFSIPTVKKEIIGLFDRFGLSLANSLETQTVKFIKKVKRWRTIYFRF